METMLLKIAFVLMITAAAIIAMISGLTVYKNSKFKKEQKELNEILSKKGSTFSFLHKLTILPLSYLKPLEKEIMYYLNRKLNEESSYLITLHIFIPTLEGGELTEETKGFIIKLLNYLIPCEWYAAMYANSLKLDIRNNFRPLNKGEYAEDRQFILNNCQGTEFESYLFQCLETAKEIVGMSDQKIAEMMETEIQKLKAYFLFKHHPDLKIVLGSESKWRKMMLEEMGLAFEVMPANIDEKMIRENDPKKLTMALAKAKAVALIPRISDPVILITSDQVVVCDGVIMEKPETEEEAKRFLKAYNDSPAETVMSMVVTNTKTGKTAEATDVATVFFYTFFEETINELVKDPDVYSLCGAFKVSDGFEKQIQRIEGKRDSVIGLPKEITMALIEEVI